MIYSVSHQCWEQILFKNPLSIEVSSMEKTMSLFMNTRCIVLLFCCGALCIAFHLCGRYRLYHASTKGGTSPLPPLKNLLYDSLIRIWLYTRQAGSFYASKPFIHIRWFVCCPSALYHFHFWWMGPWQFVRRHVLSLYILLSCCMKVLVTTFYIVEDIAQVLVELRKKQLKDTLALPREWATEA